MIAHMHPLLLLGVFMGIFFLRKWLYTRDRQIALHRFSFKYGRWIALFLQPYSLLLVMVLGLFSMQLYDLIVLLEKYPMLDRQPS